MNNVVVKDIVNDGGKIHGKAVGRIRIAEHFVGKFKIGRRVWKLNFRNINSKKMVTMPESTGRKLTEKQVYREIERFLEENGIDELFRLGKGGVFFSNKMFFITVRFLFIRLCDILVDGLDDILQMSI